MEKEKGEEMKDYIPVSLEESRKFAENWKSKTNNEGNYLLFIEARMERYLKGVSLLFLC